MTRTTGRCTHVSRKGRCVRRRNHRGDHTYLHDKPSAARRSGRPA